MRCPWCNSQQFNGMLDCGYFLTVFCQDCKRGFIAPTSGRKEEFFQLIDSIHKELAIQRLMEPPKDEQ